MKLYNTIVIYDVYTVAESPEEARKALLAHVVADPTSLSEIVAIEASREGSIRAAWREQSPLVADDVSEADFEKLKGRTTMQAHDLLYKKQNPPAPKAK